MLKMKSRITGSTFVYTSTTHKFFLCLSVCLIFVNYVMLIVVYIKFSVLTSLLNFYLHIF